MGVVPTILPSGVGDCMRGRGDVESQGARVGGCQRDEHSAKKNIVWHACMNQPVKGCA
jgi:hypothetical protein